MKEAARYEVQPKSPIKIITYHFTDHAKIWRHWHEYLEIIYPVSGSFTLKADDEVLEVGGGDIVILNPFQVHESIHLSKKNEYYVFIIPPEFIFSRHGDRKYRFRNVITNSPDCVSALKKAAELSDLSDRESDFLLNSEIFRFLHCASLKHAYTAEESSEYINKNRYIVEDIKNRISYCYAEPINIELLAGGFFVSISHLQHTFKEQTGHSITDYINKTRIENSKKLLEDTELRISVIAEKVGIFDYNYFSRVFKKYEGISPSQYRKNIRKKG